MNATISRAAGITFAAALLLAGCSAGFSEAGDGPEESSDGGAPPAYASFASAAAPQGGGAGNATKGRTLYQTYCASCHGTTGKGDGPAAAILSPQPRDHTNRVYMSTLTDENLAEIISRGGVALGRSPAMPPAKTLSDEDIADLIAAVRDLAR